MSKMNKKRKNVNGESIVLVTTDEYMEAPVGTICAQDDDAPYYKSTSDDNCPTPWERANDNNWYSSQQLAGTERKVLRNGQKK